MTITRLKQTFVGVNMPFIDDKTPQKWLFKKYNPSKNT